MVRKKKAPRKGRKGGTFTTVLLTRLHGRERKKREKRSNEEGVCPPLSSAARGRAGGKGKEKRKRREAKERSALGRRSLLRGPLEQVSREREGKRKGKELPPNFLSYGLRA